MSETQIYNDIIYILLYGGIIAMALLLSCYLLFRKSNAFAPNINPPKRLRKWTAIMFISIMMSHLWYLPSAFLSSKEAVETSILIGAMLDLMTVFPIAIVVSLCLLQDRNRPLWPIALLPIPTIAGLTFIILNNNIYFLIYIYAYVATVGLGIIIYIVRALWQYRQWLRENFADLEQKEVWQTFVVQSTILLLFIIYVSGANNTYYEYIVQIGDGVIMGYLLWRVETLNDLNAMLKQNKKADDNTESAENLVTDNVEEIEDDNVEEIEDEDVEVTESQYVPQYILDRIDILLNKHCGETKMYLQHDLTITQLASDLGTNRFYLSQYFSNRGITYNSYIHDLRINHFIDLYGKAIASRRPFTTKQLALESGYRSYSTFSLAFKEKMGQTVRMWMSSYES